MPRLPYAVIAAAGRGTRFQGQHKLLAPVRGMPCVQRVVQAVEAGLGDHRQVAVVGHGAEEVCRVVGEAPHRVFVYQPRQRGTGDALCQALKAVSPSMAGSVYFFCGDKPLLTGDTIARFRQAFRRSEAAMMFLVGRLEDSADELPRRTQGRVVQVEQGGGGWEALGIVEHRIIAAMADGETLSFRDGQGRERRWTRDDLFAIREVNVSAYAWRGPELWQLVQHLDSDNAQGELLITDLVEIYRRHGLQVETWPLSCLKEGEGIDTVEQWRRIASER